MNELAELEELLYSMDISIYSKSKRIEIEEHYNHICTDERVVRLFYLLKKIQERGEKK